MSVCQVRELVHRVVTTRCGITTNLAHASVWHSQVTCTPCRNGTTQPSEADEYAASFADIAPHTSRPA